MIYIGVQGCRDQDSGLGVEGLGIEGSGSLGVQGFAVQCFKLLYEGLKIQDGVLRIMGCWRFETVGGLGV